MHAGGRGRMRRFFLTTRRRLDRALEKYGACLYALAVANAVACASLKSGDVAAPSDGDAAVEGASDASSVEGAAESEASIDGSDGDNLDDSRDAPVDASDINLPPETPRPRGRSADAGSTSALEALARGRRWGRLHLHGSGQLGWIGRGIIYDDVDARSTRASVRGWARLARRRLAVFFSPGLDGQPEHRRRDARRESPVLGEQQLHHVR